MSNIIMAIFETESEAYQSFSELKHIRPDDKTQIAQLAVVKKEANQVLLKDSIDFNDTSRDYAAIGGLVGGLVGILSGPIGVIIGYGIGSLAGAASGSMADSSNNNLIEEVTTKLLDGDTALILLAHEEDEAVLDTYLSAYKTSIMRWDALAVAHEVELAGKIQDELYENVQKVMNQRRLEHLKEQGSDIADSLKATFKRLRGKK
ncbi:DUF1269 domain-containing protein [Streptococcus chenjunshii]|uniref:DUF1269 domain-containing protein n=1 Tax=Streptococcus chenjunshii TaxID=2173853 RepID=A0A372KNK9_9STRE|nr:DUF1269 domain-containing protein [Streptococcus chenjunshii]AXQ77954.1 DUF1269 domain-containing protein [Streptococcus chenjunshii]RFU51802.1 DUF1269 domain-containing protein [Streptococcus chenjunshii]RFU53890.1 DUF1269 domain-containing protein [Streptococcus chenjunshii]